MFRDKPVWMRREDSKQYDDGYREAESNCNQQIERALHIARVKQERVLRAAQDAAQGTALRACNV